MRTFVLRNRAFPSTRPLFRLAVIAGWLLAATVANVGSADDVSPPEVAEAEVAVAKVADPMDNRLEAIESKVDAIFQWLEAQKQIAPPEKKEVVTPETERPTETKPSGPAKPAESQPAESQASESQPSESQPKPKPGASGVVVQQEWLKELPWRSIGPANMSGRITDIAIDGDDPSLWWIATASGGMLKSTNHGVSMEHQFDDQSTVSIGAIANDPNDKDVIWVGTGEANPRNSVSYGNGVYKSVDGGKTWAHLGLEESYQIGRIVIDPTDSDTVYVGALGRLYGPNRERGVFKTTDGGKTWAQSLYVDDNTGVVDMVMNPTDPKMLIAAMWDRERDEFDSWPGSVKQPDGVDGYDPIRKWGPGAGLYRTIDAGESWARITDGLPTGQMGRIGLDWQTKSPHTLYAIIDCEDIGKGPRPFDAFLGLVGIDTGDGESNKTAVITQVMKDSPAARAGAKVGDRLTMVEGKAIASFDDLLVALREKKPGQRISFTLARGDETLDMKPKLTVRPGSRQRTPTVWLGVTGSAEDAKVTIKTVSKKSPAEKAGLEPGDQIVSADGKVTQAYDELIKQIQNMADGDEVTLEIIRGDESKSIVATIENRPVSGNPPPSRAIMGIQGENVADDGGARMVVVTDNGPAAKAGLKTGDVVVKLGDTKIKGYETLVDEIQARQPDETVAVVVVRDQKQVSLDITLGDRNASIGDRPYTYSYFGQQPNAQDMQGADGARYGGVYKSTDMGETWRRVNSLNTRPMYFSVIRVDPSDDQLVYVLGVSQFVSRDGGLTFESDFGRGVHADAHDLWIDPADGRHMIIAGDGGVYVSYDSGELWDHINTAAIGQFYHVAISPKQPYWVVGGLQDNGSWAGPAISRNGGAINEDWISVGGGDGFVCRVDPNDPDLMYYESQNGAIAWRHLVTGERASVRPMRQEGVEYRFNWETPYILSSHNSRIFYSAGNYVFRSLDRGRRLQAISPEITRTPRGSATDLSESPRDPNVLYVGTDDGALWVTRDGGVNWTDITANLGAPGPRWVASVEASRFADGRVYVALDGHRSDDDNAYAFVSNDFGATFQPLHRNLPRGSARCLREDTVNENLLYLGTEFAFWVSLDGGQHWGKCNQSLPTVAVFDVAVHPSGDEIVLATHGRSLWACDVSILRSISAASMNEKMVFYPPTDVTRWRFQPSRGGTNRRYVGENPSRGSQFWYSLSEKVKSTSFQIKGIDGKVLSEIKGETQPGLHSITWNLTQTISGNSRRGQRAAGFRGGARPVPSGSYQVAWMVDGKQVSTRVVTVNSDPTLPASAVADEVVELQRLMDEIAAEVKAQAKAEGRDVYQDN